MIAFLLFLVVLAGIAASYGVRVAAVIGACLAILALTLMALSP